MSYKIMRLGQPYNLLLTEVMDSLPTICDKAYRDGEIEPLPRDYFMQAVCVEISKIAVQYPKCRPPHLVRWEDRWGKQFLSIHKSYEDYTKSNMAFITVSF